MQETFSTYLYIPLWLFPLKMLVFPLTDFYFGIFKFCTMQDVMEMQLLWRLTWDFALFTCCRQSSLLEKKENPDCKEKKKNPTSPPPPPAPPQDARRDALSQPKGSGLTRALEWEARSCSLYDLMAAPEQSRGQTEAVLAAAAAPEDPCCASLLFRGLLVCVCIYIECFSVYPHSTTATSSVGKKKKKELKKKGLAREPSDNRGVTKQTNKQTSK